MLANLRNRLGPKSVAAMMRCAIRYGLRTAVQVYVGNRPRAITAGFAHPLYIRGAHDEREIFSEVFLEEQYGHRAIKACCPRVIVDAGANIGMVSIYYAQMFPSARIISIEPHAGNFSVLQRNVASYPNVTPLRAALWHEETTVEIADPDVAGWAFQCKEASNGSVPTVTIPGLIEKYGLDEIDILKIDIEGAERQVFGPDSAWLSRVRYLCIELHDRTVPGCAQAVYRAACARNFNKFQRGDVDVLEFSTEKSTA